ncbi:beta-propeller domain-containing protein [Candidatus Micrarchaeota archaeon]|nr:beta-propeller domain-containing protein [Candidatus Micrarchaeota archaeon]
MKQTVLELLGAGAVVIVFFTVLIALGGTAQPVLPGITPTPGPSVNPSISAAPGSAILLSSPDLKTFTSWDQAKAFLQASSAGQNNYRTFGNEMMIGAAVPLGAVAKSAADTSSAPSVSSGSGSSDYSTTNVQVAGVDEDDTMKTDGKYVYTVTNGQIVIVDAYPALQAHIVAILNETDATYQSIFIKGNKLVAFGTKNFAWEPMMKPLIETETNASASQEEYGVIVFNPTSGSINVYNGTDAPDNETVQAPTDPSSESGGSAVAPSGVASSKMAVGAMPICLGCRPYYYGQQANFMKIFDVSDHAKPVLLKEIDSKGNLVAARLIGNRVYAIFNEYAGYQYPRPAYAVDGQLAQIAPSDVRYIDYPFDNVQFTTVLGQDLDNVNNPEGRTVVLTGGASTIYVSGQNAYVTNTQYQSYYPQWQPYQDTLDGKWTTETSAKLAAIDASTVSDWQKDRLKVQVADSFLQSANETDSAQWYAEIYKRQQALREKQTTPSEVTAVHKFALGDTITYLGKGAVPGHLLNQFSMDESNGYIRMATTVSQQGVNTPMMRVANDVLPGAGQFVQPTPIPSKNNVYVLDSALKQVGKLEDLAPGESIYSVRFMGKRAYLVTFRQLDPLFVIGLEDPANPTLLGKLKIPGYSNYLHPYDETHLIGLGKDAIPLKDSNSAFPLGLKLSMFDVSDVANPKEVATLGIGDAGSDSVALSDHKAFLFNKEKNLLVIPVRLAVIPAEKKTGDLVHVYGDVTFQGAYVFSTASCEPQVAAQCEFQLRGTVGHADPETLAKMGDYYYGSGTDVTRSAYIDNTLYTLSEKYLKANDLGTLAAQASVSLPQPPQSQYPYPYYVD